MKVVKLIIITLLLFGCKKNKQSNLKSKDLIIVEQDYNKALSLAQKENKLLFIDFYTTWCAPCKELDRLVFNNDSIKKILNEKYVLLKYNAENDTVFHLSKKYHIRSYPTGIILNNRGFLVNIKYGFPGNNSFSLQNNVIKFTDESIVKNEENKIIKGYSNKIDPYKYPKFYVDYVNRTNIKINKTELDNYLNNYPNKFSEEYFSTLMYFSKKAPESVADEVVKNKQKYINLYSKNDVEILLFFLATSKFNTAISEINKEAYKKAVEFTKQALSKEWVDDILPNFEKDFLIAQNKWNDVFEINKNLKENGKFDNGYINHFSWQVYKKCDNQEVIAKCIKWMKEVTEQESNYAYLDTYAHLVHKSGNKKETKRIAKMAIEAAKKENKSIKNLERLLLKQ